MIMDNYPQITCETDHQKSADETYQKRKKLQSIQTGVNSYFKV